MIDIIVENKKIVENNEPMRQNHYLQQNKNKEANKNTHTNNFDKSNRNLAREEFNKQEFKRAKKPSIPLMYIFFNIGKFYVIFVH